MILNLLSGLKKLHSDLSYALLMHSCALAQINMSRGIFCLRAMYEPKFTGPARPGPQRIRPGPARWRLTNYRPGPARSGPARTGRAGLTGRLARADLYPILIFLALHNVLKSDNKTAIITRPRPRRWTWTPQRRRSCLRGFATSTACCALTFDLQNLIRSSVGDYLNIPFSFIKTVHARGE